MNLFVVVLVVLLTTLAASFIWGINTLFLLDAGLSNLEAFAANASNPTAPMVVASGTVPRTACQIVDPATQMPNPPMVAPLTSAERARWRSPSPITARLRT